MKAKIEILAACAVIASLVAVPMGIWWYENHFFVSRFGEDAMIIKLTAAARQGRVTLDRVTGYNYWSGKFARLDTITVPIGQKVVLVVKSADVTHSFQVRGDLDIDQPIEMEGGHTKVAVFTPEKTGSYMFECKSFCGCAHHAMFFKIEVVDKKREGNTSKEKGR